MVGWISSKSRGSKTMSPTLLKSCESHCSVENVKFQSLFTASQIPRDIIKRLRSQIVFSASTRYIYQFTRIFSESIFFKLTRPHLITLSTVKTFSKGYTASAEQRST